MTILRRLNFSPARSAAALAGACLVLACLFPAPARGDAFGSWNGLVTAFAKSQGHEQIGGEPCVYEDATQLCHLFNNEQFTLGTVAIPAQGIYPDIGTVSALIEGTSLMVSASTQRFADGTVSDGEADASLEASGVVSVDGGGIAALNLLDQVVNQFVAGSGKAFGYFEVGAEWGPYNSATGVTEITNLADYHWDLPSAFGCNPGHSEDIGATVSEYDNTVCLQYNSPASVQIPIDVADGDGLLIYLGGSVHSQGDASVSIHDPLSVELPEGVTFSQTTFPMTYAPTPAEVPEPSTLWLLSAGLLGLAWVARRRRASDF